MEAVYAGTRTSRIYMAAWAKFRRFIIPIPIKAGIYQLWWSFDNRPETHLVEDILLQVNTRGDLDQFHSLLRQIEDAPLREIENRLMILRRIESAEGLLLDLLDEFSFYAPLIDRKPSIDNGHLQVSRRKGPRKHNLFSILADVDESPETDEPLRILCRTAIGTLNIHSCPLGYHGMGRIYSGITP
jgi:hypothetical protein